MFDFVAFLYTDLDGARHIAAGLRVSGSIGAADLHSGMTAQDLFNAADTNRYRPCTAAGTRSPPRYS